MMPRKTSSETIREARAASVAASASEIGAAIVSAVAMRGSLRWPRYYSTMEIAAMPGLGAIWTHSTVVANPCNLFHNSKAR